MRGLLVGDGGLISAEVHRRRYLVTPPGRRRAKLNEPDHWMVDLGGIPLGGGTPIDEGAWKPHRFLYHIDVERQAGAPANGRLAPIRAAILATPPMTLALLHLQPTADRLTLGAATLPVVRRFDEASLVAAVTNSDTVALVCSEAPSCVLAAGEDVWQAVNALE